MLRTITVDELPDRRRAVDAEARRVAGELIDQVGREGESALRQIAERFGEIEVGQALVIERSELIQAADALSLEERGVLERSAARIRRFAEAQRACLVDLDLEIPGGRAGHRVVPVASAGCYAPGGRYPLPSSVLMTAIPARVAGVDRVLVASPNPGRSTLAAAAIAGADGVLRVGGAQAIAALALGVGVDPVDLVCGPGNRFVTAAKQLLSDRVRVPMLAGPSELLIFAAGLVDPRLIAADLLAQAEHDPLALPMLITTEATLVPLVRRELEAQLVDLPSAPIARESLLRGFAILVADLTEGAAVVESLAPEHLELIGPDAEALAGDLGNAAAIFVGSASAEVFGDYGAGPNHCLPTGGSARARAGLSVFDFLKLPTILEIDDPTAAAELTADAIALARLEGLEAHARSASRRLVTS